MIINRKYSNLISLREKHANDSSYLKRCVSKYAVIYVIGCAVSQAVRRWFPIAGARFDPRAVHVRYMVQIVTSSSILSITHRPVW
jgi:hypothetical protein